MEKRNKQNQMARERIVSAMMELTEKKPISAVTVQELTDRAGVSRMTFYRNYSSKEDVFLSQIQDILERYQQDVEDKDLDGYYCDRAHIRHGFSYFYQYRDFVSTLMRCGLSDQFLQRLTQFALGKWLKKEDDKMTRCSIVAHVGLMFNSFLSWIGSAQSQTLDELTDMVSAICQRAFLSGDHRRKPRPLDQRGV